MKLKEDIVYLFSDGSSNSRDELKAGGWGAVLYHKSSITGREQYKELNGGKLNTTNNEMELMGIYKGLQSIKSLGSKKVVVYSDSQYCVNIFNDWYRQWRQNDWKTATGKDVKNLDLIKDILTLYEPNKETIHIRWIKGHAGFEYNEKADELAGLGRHRIRAEETLKISTQA